MDGAEITLEPWNPWPLAIPGVLLVVGIVLVFVGTLGARRRWARDLGIILVVGGPLLGLGMFAFLGGTWDQAQRRAALEGLGFEHPTFSGGTGIVGSATPSDVDFRAERDGEEVSGTLRWIAGDHWAVVVDASED
ncbi:hypothetical protein ACDF64_05370 [Agromyces sp. MMS24-JH15]|uniref:hypothetical protein n=1 Tax=Agromyces sp. MMS24-JH15 TaxID=3243765 RepID=UPI003749FB84